MSSQGVFSFPFCQEMTLQPSLPQKPGTQSMHQAPIPRLHHTSGPLYPKGSSLKLDIPTAPSPNQRSHHHPSLKIAPHYTGLFNLGLLSPQPTKNPMPPPTKRSLSQQSSPQHPGALPTQHPLLFPSLPTKLSHFLTLRSAQNSTFLLPNSSALLSAAEIAQLVLAAECC